MLPSTGDDHREFYSFSNGKVKSVFFQEVRRRLLSSKGWLISPTPEAAKLLHPFSGTSIQLALYMILKKLQKHNGTGQIMLYYLPVLILQINYALVVKLFGLLTFWRPGDFSWTTISSNKEFDTMVCCKGKYYAVDNAFDVWAFDLLANQLQSYGYLVSLTLPSATRQVTYSSLIYPMHHILLFGGMVRITPLHFLYMNSIDVTNAKVTEINTLKDSSILLNNNESTCVDTSRCITGFKPNHIYYTNEVTCCGNGDIYKIYDEDTLW